MYLKQVEIERPMGEAHTSDGGSSVPQRSSRSFDVVGLFAGIGGLELGFERQGHKSVMLCEADPRAQSVLVKHFRECDLTDDVTRLKGIPACDVLTAGFPCQDLSQAGKLRGISGPNSGLVDALFSLLDETRSPPEWVVLENVPFMLRLQRGSAIDHVVTRLEQMGFAWAYRIVDARAFGLPQRRRRVVILASKQHDPRGPLLGIDAGPPENKARGNHACGFYWTEGNTGIGWAVDSTPPLKGGSGLHIPSPPAIWFPRRRLVATPSIRDAERLQGFPADWTRLIGDDPRGERQRWRLIGNAVSVPLSSWIAERLASECEYSADSDMSLDPVTPWPNAAWGVDGRRGISSVSEWPIVARQNHLASFLRHQVKPLSKKATEGFLGRLEKSSLRSEEGFRLDLKHHIQAVT